MPYVARGKNGAIIAVFNQKNDCAEEHVGADDRELQAFLGLSATKQADQGRAVGRSKIEHALRQSDADFVRVLDDLITVLLNKGMIVFTDLPPHAQQKLMIRRRLRDRARDLGNLVADAEDIKIA